MLNPGLVGMRQHDELTKHSYAASSIGEAAQKNATKTPTTFTVGTKAK
jgi:hypothetical protein